MGTEATKPNASEPNQTVQPMNLKTWINYLYWSIYKWEQTGTHTVSSYTRELTGYCVYLIRGLISTQAVRGARLPKGTHSGRNRPEHNRESRWSRCVFMVSLCLSPYGGYVGPLETACCLLTIIMVYSEWAITHILIACSGTEPISISHSKPLTTHANVYIGFAILL